MDTFNIYKNPSYYTTKHNEYMMTVIRHYPGIKVITEDAERICVDAIPDAADFLRHMNDCDLIAID